MPIFRVKSVKIYTGQFFFTQTCLWCLWQIKGMLGCPSTPRPIWFEPGQPLAFAAIGFCICSKRNQFLAKQISCRQIPRIPGGPGSPLPSRPPSTKSTVPEGLCGWVLVRMHRWVFDYIHIQIFDTFSLLFPKPRTSSDQNATNRVHAHIQRAHQQNICSRKNSTKKRVKIQIQLQIQK